MWKDPTNVTKRKPQRLRGTPANRFVNVIAISVFSTICLASHWYTTTDAEWVVRARARTVERVKPTVREQIRREMFQDSFMASAINTINERAAEGTGHYSEDDNN